MAMAVICILKRMVLTATGNVTVGLVIQCFPLFKVVSLALINQIVHFSASYVSNGIKT